MGDNALDILIGNRLKQKRKLTGLNQTEFGKKFGLSRAKIGDIERGRSSIPAATLSRIAKYVNVDINYFFEQSGPLAELEDLARLDPTLTNEAANLLRDFNALNDPALRREFAAILKRAAQLIEQKKRA